VTLDDSPARAIQSDVFPQAIVNSSLVPIPDPLIAGEVSRWAWRRSEREIVLVGVHCCAGLDFMMVCEACVFVPCTFKNNVFLLQ